VPDESDLDSIKSAGAGAPDETAEKELEGLEVSEEKETKRLQNLGLKQDIALRKDFAWDIFYLIVVWLCAIFGILLLQGFQVGICGHAFKLDDSVVLALIGGTTINVLGIFIIVVRYLFPQRTA
jgi:hypothetical protein